MLLLVPLLVILSPCAVLSDSDDPYLANEEDAIKLNNDTSSCGEICLPLEGPCKCNKRKGAISCAQERLKTANLCPHPNFENDTFRYVVMSGMELTILRKDAIFPENNEQIEELDMSDNLIKELPDDVFAGFDILDDLNLAHNRILKINRKTFRHLSKLITLDLRHNYISDLTEDPFEGIPNLVYLYLDNNNINKISRRTFEPLNKLLVLSLDDAGLTTLDGEWLEPLKNLKTLSLGGNKLMIVPDLHLPKLEMLTMTNNDFTEIGKYAFDGLPKLQILRLGDQDSLWLVDDCAFCRLPELYKLELNHCLKLASLSTAAFGDTLPTNELDLSGNGLESMKESLLRDWSKVRTVRLEGNPWKCDCEIIWMTKIKDAQEDITKCASPVEQKGRDIRLLHPEDLRCPASKGGRAYVIILFLILVISGIAFSWFVWPGKRAYKSRCGPLFQKQSSAPQYTYNNLATEAQGDFDKVNLVTEDVLDHEHNAAVRQQNGHTPEPVML